MIIIGFLSDSGIGSNLSAKAQALVYKDFPDAKVVDISHTVKPFNVQQAAFVLDDALDYFPAGSIHVVLMETRLKQYGRHLLALYRGQYILTADNGLLTYFENKGLDGALEIKTSPEQTDDLMRLIQVAVFLAKGADPLEIGKPITQWLSIRASEVKITDSQLIGEVIHVDSYGNLISNITKEQFDMFLDGSSPSVIINRYETINKISLGIEKQPPAETIAYFSKKGYLKIVIKNDHAAKLHGMRLGSHIIVEKK